MRVTFDRPDHPIAYGYPAHTWVFRQNFPLYNTPRRWLRMAYCTTCHDGPEDRSGIVMEWGDRAASFLPPTGMGIVLNAGPIIGGGFLSIDVTRGQ